MAFTPPFHAIHRDGARVVVDRVEDLHPVRGLIGTRHVSTRIRPDGLSATYVFEWIVRDSLGAVVLPSDVPEPPAVPSPRLAAARRAALAGLPIPGVGRLGRGRFRRSVSCHGACREAAALAADLACGVEGISDRQAAALRHGACVDGRSARPRGRGRSWKDQRRKRWTR